jgi:short-subunit dehydrogenase
VALSNGLRNELRQFGIEVTTIIPGLMRTGSHINAKFKGYRSSEAVWFGSAASLPLVSLNARRAARLAVDAVCAGKTEKILGVPALILSRAQTLLPGLTSELLQLANAWLPSGNSDSVLQAGRELESDLGPLYRLVTALGRRAGHGLNQTV